MMTVYPDNRTMRRRKQHYILDKSDQLMWTGALMGSCLQWLYDNGEFDFMLQTETSLFQVHLALLSH